MRGAVFAVVVMIPMVGLAQEEETPPYVYAIYFECDAAGTALADEIVDTAFAGVYDAAVEAGEIRSWGWLAHHTGSKWRRLIYHSAPDLDSLLAGLQSTDEATQEKYPAMSRAFGEICGTHEDYIWQHVTGSQPGTLPAERGKAGFSAYYQCKVSQEQRADEIVKEVFAPVYNKHTGEGKLSSWGWMQHWVGGKYRRIWTMSGADHSSVLEARDAIYQELMESHEDALQEFDQICGSHQDNMWNILHEKP